MRSFLVIGLGGSGGKTIRYLKQSLNQWLGEIGWASGLPQGWQFLHIDTPSTQEAPILPGRPELLPPIEYMSLHRDGVPFETVVERLTRKQTNFDGWWVDPDTRLHGVGAALVKAAEDWARDRGLTEMASDALITNEISHAAHRALGYAETDRVVCFLKRL